MSGPVQGRPNDDPLGLFGPPTTQAAQQAPKSPQGAATPSDDPLGLFSDSAATQGTPGPRRTLGEAVSRVAGQARDLFDTAADKVTNFFKPTVTSDASTTQFGNAGDAGLFPSLRRQWDRPGVLPIVDRRTVADKQRDAAAAQADYQRGLVRQAAAPDAIGTKGRQVVPVGSGQRTVAQLETEQNRDAAIVRAREAEHSTPRNWLSIAAKGEEYAEYLESQGRPEEADDIRRKAENARRVAELKSQTDPFSHRAIGQLYGPFGDPATPDRQRLAEAEGSTFTPEEQLAMGVEHPATIERAQDASDLGAMAIGQLPWFIAGSAVTRGAAGLAARGIAESAEAGGIAARVAPVKRIGDALGKFAGGEAEVAARIPITSRETLGLRLQQEAQEFVRSLPRGLTEGQGTMAMITYAQARDQGMTPEQAATAAAEGVGINAAFGVAAQAGLGAVGRAAGLTYDPIGRAFVHPVMSKAREVYKKFRAGDETPVAGTGEIAMELRDPTRETMAAPSPEGGRDELVGLLQALAEKRRTEKETGLAETFADVYHAYDEPIGPEPSPITIEPTYRTRQTGADTPLRSAREIAMERTAPLTPLDRSNAAVMMQEEARLQREQAEAMANDPNLRLELAAQARPGEKQGPLTLAQTIATAKDQADQGDPLAVEYRDAIDKYVDALAAVRDLPEDKAPNTRQQIALARAKNALNDVRKKYGTQLGASAVLALAANDEDLTEDEKKLVGLAGLGILATSHEGGEGRVAEGERPLRHPNAHGATRYGELIPEGRTPREKRPSFYEQPATGIESPYTGHGSRGVFSGGMGTDDKLWSRLRRAIERDDFGGQPQPAERWLARLKKSNQFAQAELEATLEPVLRREAEEGGRLTKENVLNALDNRKISLSREVHDSTSGTPEGMPLELTSRIEDVTMTAEYHERNAGQYERDIRETLRNAGVTGTSMPDRLIRDLINAANDEDYGARNQIMDALRDDLAEYIDDDALLDRVVQNIDRRAEDMADNHRWAREARSELDDLENANWDDYYSDEEKAGGLEYEGTQAIPGAADNPREVLIHLAAPTELDTKGDFNEGHWENGENLVVHYRSDDRRLTPVREAKPDPVIEAKKARIKELSDEITRLNNQEMERLRAAGHTVDPNNLGPLVPHVLPEIMERGRTLQNERTALENEITHAVKRGGNTGTDRTRVVFEVQSVWSARGQEEGFVRRNPPLSDEQKEKIHNEIQDRRREIAEVRAKDAELHDAYAKAFKAYENARVAEVRAAHPNVTIGAYNLYIFDNPADGLHVPKSPEVLELERAYDKAWLDYKSNQADTNELDSQIYDLGQQLREYTNGVPDTPFRDHGVALSLGIKQSILDAVADDMDRLAWATPEDRMAHANLDEGPARFIYEELFPAVVKKMATLLNEPVEIEPVSTGGYELSSIKLTKGIKDKLRKLGLPLMGVVAAMATPDQADAETANGKTLGPEGLWKTGLGIVTAGAALAYLATHPEARRFVKSIKPLAKAFRELEESAPASAATFYANPIGPALRAVAKYPSAAALGAVGYIASGSDNKNIREAGPWVMGLAALSAVGSKRLVKGKNKVLARLFDQLKQTREGRMLGNALNPDKMIAPEALEAILTREQEAAKGPAVASQVARQLEQLGPVGDRAVTDLLDKEQWEDTSTLSPAQTTAVLTMAAAAEAALRESEQATLATGARQPGDLLPDYSGKRLYAKYEAEAASHEPNYPGRRSASASRATISSVQHRTLDEPVRQATSAWKDAIASGDPQRIQDALDALDAAKVENYSKRTELGEIRESSRRIPAAIQQNYIDAANAKALTTLRTIPGVVHPEWSNAFDDLQAAKAMKQAATTQADKDAAQTLIDQATVKLAEVSEEATRTGNGWVKLPDTRAWGPLRGAVVDKTIAHELTGFDERSWYTKALNAWKSIKTKFNPGTNVGNVLSNVGWAHIKGLPVWEQLLPVMTLKGPKEPYLLRAAKMMHSYGPGAKELAEVGIIGHGNASMQAGGLSLREVGKTEGLEELLKTTRPETADVLRSKGITETNIRRRNRRDLAIRATAGAALGAAKGYGPDADVEDEIYGAAVGGLIGALLNGKVRRTITKTYGHEDDIFKVALWLKMVDGGKTPDAATKYFTDRPSNFGMGRSRSPVINVLASTTHPFIRWTANALPEFASDVVDHPWRYMTLLGAAAAFNEYADEEEGPIPDSDVPIGQRRTGGYALPGLTHLPWTDEQGNKAAVDVSRWTPLSAITTSAPPGTVVSSIDENAPGILQPGGPVIDAAAKYGVNVDPWSGRPFLQRDYPAAENIGTLLSSLAGTVLPSALDIHADRLRADVENRDYSKLATDALGPTGLKPRYIRPGANIKQAEFELKESLRTMKHDLGLRLRANESPDPARAERLVQQYIGRVNQAVHNFKARIGVDPDAETVRDALDVNDVRDSRELKRP